MFMAWLGGRQGRAKIISFLSPSYWTARFSKSVSAASYRTHMFLQVFRPQAIGHHDSLQVFQLPAIGSNAFLRALQPTAIGPNDVLRVLRPQCIGARNVVRVVQTQVIGPHAFLHVFRRKAKGLQSHMATKHIKNRTFGEPYKILWLLADPGLRANKTCKSTRNFQRTLQNPLVFLLFQT